MRCQNTHHTVRVRGERGSVVLGIAIGVVTVLSILLGAQYFVQSSTRQETAIAHLGSRSLTVLESCLDETSYRVFGEANGLTEKRDLGETLRTFIPRKPGDKKEPKIDKDGFRARFAHTVPLTRAAYGNDPDVDIQDASYGILDQQPFPGMVGLQTNESRGVIGVDAAVTLRLKGSSIRLKRTGRHEMEFKTVVLGLPYPFNRFTFFDRALEEDPLALPTATATATATSVTDKDCQAKRDRFAAYYCAYDKFRDKFRTEHPTQPLADFPVLAMDPEAPTTAPASTASTPPTTPSSGPIYSKIAHMGDGPYGFHGYSIPFFRGEKDLMSEYGNEAEEMSNQFLPMDGQMFRKAAPGEAKELAKYYHLLEEDAFKERRTHVFSQMANLVEAISKDGVLELGGIYWVDGPVIVDHEYRGHGVIVTPDPAGVTVRRARRDEKVDGHLTVVALKGHVEARGDPTEVHASLVAVHGTMRGFTRSKIYGTVYISFLANDGEDGPEIQRQADSDWAPITKDTERPKPGLARRLRAFIVPQSIRKDHFTSRGRS